MYIVSGDSESHWTVIKHLPARREHAEGGIRVLGVTLFYLIALRFFYLKY